VDRFAQTVQTPPEELVGRSTQDAAVGLALDRWIMGLLIRELEADPGYASIPAEVDELAEACRQFSAHVARRVGSFAGEVPRILPQLVRSGERPLEAAFPEAGVILRGRIDALFGNRTGELDVVEYKLTDEANAPLDHAQVALYRELLKRSEGLDAHPVILRFMPEVVQTQIPSDQADRLVAAELIPLLERMRGWLARPESVPPTAHKSLCAVCPVQRICSEQYPQHLLFRDDPPAVACRPRPSLEGPLVVAQPRTQKGSGKPRSCGNGS
jgi:CRISPR/Cas system-associated exonuclease Cas4 (RecB family)